MPGNIARERHLGHTFSPAYTQHVGAEDCSPSTSSKTKTSDCKRFSNPHKIRYGEWSYPCIKDFVSFQFRRFWQSLLIRVIRVYQW
jgi:hypothetical protein